MAPKGKASEKAGEPAAKKAKTEEPKKEEPPKAEAEADKAAPEEPDTTEKETDAPADKRPVLKAPIVFNASDATLNIVPVYEGKVLKAFTDGGMQYLIAGARASTGLKAGRYMFEVRILEALPVQDQAWNARNAPKARQLLRVGFSTGGSSLVLGDGQGGVCFENDGGLWTDGKRTNMGKKFFREQTIAVLLNLDPKSPNANTISLFRSGERLTQPQPLPESLQGKTLYPHVSFRNVSVQVNFGPEPLTPLPFTCRMAGAAAQADSETLPGAQPKDGKYDVLFPVGYPDEGTFEWLDAFLAKNPHYVELSDRKIVEWAVASGVWRNSKYSGKGGSNDKPLLDTTLPSLDDFSVRSILQAFAPVMPRHYVVMEVVGNLIPEEREKVLKRFNASCFKKTACVVMGEPPAEYKAVQQEKALRDKQTQADKEWHAKKAEKARKKAAAERAKKMAEQKKEAAEKRKKLIEEANRKREEAAAKKKAEAEAKKKAEAGEAGEEGEEKAEGDKNEEAKEEEAQKMEVDEGTKETEKKEDDKEEEDKEEKKDEVAEEEDDDMGEEPPKVELTDEEKKVWFAWKPGFDVKENRLASCFDKFSLPAKAEGFDDVRFEWQKEGPAKEYLHEKVLAKKKTSRVESLQPSQSFQDRWAAFKKVFAEWQKKQTEFKNSPEQKAKAAKKAAKKDGEEAEEEQEDKAMSLDLFSVEDVSDIGEGEPLYKDFEMADWALCQLRFEMWTLQEAFKKDVDDPDRPAVPLAHFNFYFNRYFKKTLNPKAFGVDDASELAKLIKDTVAWEEELLTTPLTIGEEEDPSIFVKYTEEARRERQRRIDAGDETARLKVQPSALSGAPPPRSGGGNRGGGKGAPAATRPSGAGGAPPPPPQPALPGVKPVGVAAMAAAATKGGGKKGGGSWGWGSGGSAGGWKGGAKGGKGKW